MLQWSALKPTSFPKWTLDTAESTGSSGCCNILNCPGCWLHLNSPWTTNDPSAYLVNAHVSLTNLNQVCFIASTFSTAFVFRRKWSIPIWRPPSISTPRWCHGLQHQGQDGQWKMIYTPAVDISGMRYATENDIIRSTCHLYPARCIQNLQPRCAASLKKGRWKRQRCRRVQEFKASKKGH